MAGLFETLERWSQVAWPVLLDAAAKGAILLILSAGAVAVMRRASAAARQMTWTVALAAVLAMPLASALLPEWRVLPDWTRIDLPASASAPAPERAGPSPGRSAIAEPTPLPPAPEPVPDEATTLPLPLPGGGDPVAPQAVPAVSPAPPPAVEPLRPWRFTVLAWVPPAWLAGAIVCLAPLVLGRVGLWRLARRSRRVEAGPLLDEAGPAAAAVGLPRVPRLLLCQAEPMPLVWGVVRPTLLLPAEAADWPADRLRVVLLHEFAHARRRDCLAKLIAHAACAAHWFNPLAWLAFVWMQRDAEAACDDLVLSAGHRPSDYATHLLEIASGLKSGMLAAYSSIAMASRSKLEGRLLAILDPARSRRRLTLLLGCLAVAVGLAVLIPLGALRAREPGDASQVEVASAKDPASPALPATQPEGSQWSKPVNGLQGRLSLNRRERLNGTTIVATYLTLRNVADVGNTMVVGWDSVKMTFRVVDEAGNEVPKFNGPYDGPAFHKDELRLPHDSELTFDISTTGMGIPGGKAAMIDLGPMQSWVLDRDGKRYYLSAVLELPETRDRRADGNWAWHGRLDLPRVMVPLGVAATDAGTIGPRIEQLGRAMVGDDSSASDKAVRELSLIDDPRVAPWYVKAVRSDKSYLKMRAIDGLARFASDEALTGLKIAMRTQGKDIGNASNAQVAEQSADGVRHSAAWALARSKHPRARSLLLTMAGDHYDAVRTVVAQTAAEMTSPESLAVLRRLADDPEGSVRTEARRVLMIRMEREGARPATQPAELPNPKAVQAAVGGAWELGLHNALPQTQRILRGVIRYRIGRRADERPARVAYDVFPFDLAAFRKNLNGAGFWDNVLDGTSPTVRLLGSNEHLTVLELRNFSQPAPAASAVLVRFLSLNPAVPATQPEAATGVGRPSRERE